MLQAMRDRLKATLRRIIKCSWTPLGVCLLMCLAVAMLMMLSGCAQTREVPVVKEACPQLPALPAEFQKADVDALEQTAQNFKDFTSGR